MAHQEWSASVFGVALTLLTAACAGCSQPNAGSSKPTPEASDKRPLQDGTPIVSWEAADAMVGRIVFVEGKITRYGRSGSTHFLNFHPRDNDTFKLVLFDQTASRFAGRLDAMFQGKQVRARGMVTRHRGIAQMVITDPDQIQVVTHQPSRPRDKRLARSRNATAAPRSGVVRIATYNLENLFDPHDDPYTRDEITPAKPTPELVHLADTLQQLNADIVALQEVENQGFLESFLKRHLPNAGYHTSVVVEGNDLRGSNVGLISRLPVSSVTSHRYLRFPGPSGRMTRFRRDVLQVQIEPKRGDAFQVWVVHLKSSSTGREQAEQVRLAEVAALRKLYQQALAAGQHRIVVCGDFNDVATSPTVTQVYDASPALEPLFRTLRAEAPITYHRGKHRSMIDFIFASESMEARFVPGSYGIHTGASARQGSDHYPVFAEFQLGN